MLCVWLLSNAEEEGRGETATGKKKHQMFWLASDVVMCTMTTETLSHISEPNYCVIGNVNETLTGVPLNLTQFEMSWKMREFLKSKRKQHNWHNHKTETIESAWGSIHSPGTKNCPSWFCVAYCTMVWPVPLVWIACNPSAPWTFVICRAVTGSTVEGKR